MAEPTIEELQAKLTELQSERDALKGNRDDILKEKKRADAALKSYEGLDPDKYKQLVAAAEEADRKKAVADGDFKSLEKQLIDRHTAELGTRDTRIAKLNAALERRLVEAELTKALVEGGARKSMVDLLVLRGREYVKVRETESDFEQYVADERGNPLVADGKGTPMTIADLVQQNLKAKYPDAFEGTGSSGGGAAKSNGGAGGVVRSIPAGDTRAFMNNLEGIAKGTVTVDG